MPGLRPPYTPPPMAKGPRAACPSTYESQETGALFRCKVAPAHRCAHENGTQRWHDPAATSEAPHLGDLSGKRCTSIVRDAKHAQEFRCQYDTSPHDVQGHQHFAPDGTIRRWNDAGDYEITNYNTGRREKPVVDAEWEDLPPEQVDSFGSGVVDFFGSGDIEGKWSEFDPSAYEPLDPAAKRAIRSVERKGRRIRALMDKAQREKEHQAERLRALEVGGVPAQSHFVCECGATVAVGTAHSCNGWNARPMRSAGPLDDEPYAKKIKARIEEQERIESWDEIYDDHLPPDWARRERGC